MNLIALLVIAYGGYDVNGKQIVHKKTIKGATDKQAEKLLAEFVTQVDRGQVTTTGKLKIQDFVKKWYEEYCKKRLAPKTLETYQLHLQKRIIPALGHIDIAKLTPTQIMSFLNNLAEPGLRLDGKSGTLSDHAICIAIAFYALC